MYSGHSELSFLSFLRKCIFTLSLVFTLKITCIVVFFRDTYFLGRRETVYHAVRTSIYSSQVPERGNVYVFVIFTYN